MAGQAWLANEENWDAVYGVAREALVRLRPDELPMLEGVFTNYAELAQEGEVSVGRGRPYGFAGGEPLMSTAVTDVVINMVASLLFSAGVWTVRELAARLQQRWARGKEEAGLELGATVTAAVGKIAWLSPAERQEVERCVVEAFQNWLWPR